MKVYLIFTIVFLLSGCLNTDGDLEGSGAFSSTSIAASDLGAGILPTTVLIGNLEQLPTPLSGGGCSLNQILQWTGSNWNCIDPVSGGGGGTVTSVASGVGLTGGPITGSGTLNIDVGVGTGKILQANDIPNCTAGQKLQFAALPLGGWSCAVDIDTNLITSVHSRTGAVVAVAGDYTGAQVTNVAAGNISAVTTQAAINELDVEKLNLAGGAMSGALAMGTNKITGLGAPSLGTDAATKAYVDASGGADNLGDHMATANIQLGANFLSGDGDAEGVYVDGNGNVGLGTNSPSEVLVVTNPLDTKGEFMVENGNWVSMGANRSVAGAAGLSFIAETGVSEASIFKGATGNLVIDNAMNGDFKITSKDVFNALVIKESGFVGLGTNSPSEVLVVTNPLDTKGEFMVENGNWISMGVNRSVAGAAGMTFNADTGVSSTSIFKGATGNFIIDNAVDGDLKITSKNVFNALVVKESGNVGIGTGAPSYKLQVVGSAAKSSGGSSWAVSSDRDLKDNIEKYSKGLEAILELKPVEFKYKEGNAREHETTLTHQGFIAQDVAGEKGADGEVTGDGPFPEAVEKGADGYLSFNMHAINVAVVNAIQDLFKMIESGFSEHNDKIKAVENKNKILEQRILELENKLTKLIENR